MSASLTISPVRTNNKQPSTTTTGNARPHPPSLPYPFGDTPPVVSSSHGSSSTSSEVKHTTHTTAPDLSLPTEHQSNINKKSSKQTNDNDKTKPTRNIDLWVVSIILALSEAARGVVIPILSPLVDSLGGTPFLLSVAVALFSVGRALSSNVFGWIQLRAQQKYQPNSLLTDEDNQKRANQAVAESGRWSLLLSLFVALVGHIMFLIADGIGWLWLLLISRIATGFGTGVLTVARTIVAVSTTPLQRVKYNAWLGIVAYLGYAMTPILGSVTVSFGRVSTYSFGTFLLFICTILVLLPMIIWLVPFASRLTSWCRQRRHPRTDFPNSSPHAIELKEVMVSAENVRSDEYESSMDGKATEDQALNEKQPAADENKNNEQSVAPSANSTSSETASPASGSIVAFSDTRIACWLLIVCNGVTRGTVGVAETFGSQVFNQALGPDNDQQEDVSEFFLCLGSIGLVTFLLCDRVVKRAGEWNTLILSLVFLVVGFLFLIDFDGDLPPWRMWVGMIMVWSIGSSLVQTVIVSMFSKHVQRLQSGNGHGTQAMWMGRITAAGSWGRILLPLSMGGVVGSSNSYGRKSTAFVIVAVVQLLLSSACVWWHEALTIHPLPNDPQHRDDSEDASRESSDSDEKRDNNSSDDDEDKKKNETSESS